MDLLEDDQVRRGGRERRKIFEEGGAFLISSSLSSPGITDRCVSHVFLPFLSFSWKLATTSILLVIFPLLHMSILLPSFLPSRARYSIVRISLKFSIDKHSIRSS